VDNKKPTILIVEDDLDVAEMLNAYFRVQGYNVISVNFGEDGLRESEIVHPDLIILDIRLPDINGFEVAKKIRSHRKTKNIPIIFLTEKREREDRLTGLEIGGDDYITKPFDVQELRLRVRNALHRNFLGSLTNPVTNLPEGRLVDERLHELLDETEWTVLLISIENLDAFSEIYGFVASDDVLRAVSLMIQNTLHEIRIHTDFLGHLSATQFCLVTTSQNAKLLLERIEPRLEQSLDFFYPLKDRDSKDYSLNRLAIKIAQLHSIDGTYSDANSIKTELLNQPRKSYKPS
jgi:DNA-binding response OmpR family regulator